MNAAIPPLPNQPFPHRHRFTVHEYHQLAQAGIFDEDSHVELIAGEIIDMSPIGTHHAGWTMLLNRFFSRLVPDRVGVNIQNPIHLDEQTEPEPDLTLLAPRKQSYLEAHPYPEDVLLLIEIADTSLDYDRNEKMPLYARHGIVESWLFDVPNHSLTIYRKPAESGYREIYHPQLNETLVLSALPEISVNLAIAFKQS